MGEQKSGLSFLLYDILLLIVFVGLISTVFRFSGLFLILQIVASAIFIAFSFLGLIAITNRLRWGYTLLFIVLALVLIDLLWLFSRIRSMDTSLFITFIIAAVGFIASIVNMRRKGPEEMQREAEKVEKVEAPKAPASKNTEKKRRGRPKKRK